MEINDTYKTISEASEPILLKEKNSKFFGYAFPVTTEEEVKLHLESLRKQHPGAGHFCYAFQIGTDSLRYRANDDGEPANTAGLPIYGQLQSHKLTNVLVVVVRFFGGVKLGVGGLISAYRTAAQMSIESSEVVERTIDIHFTIAFDYKNINKVMRIIKEKNLILVRQSMNERCLIEVAVRKKNAASINAIFKQLFDVEIKQIE